MEQMTPEQRKELEEKIKNMSPEELKEFQKQQCIFCQIISGKIPSKKVYEDDKVIAVLDVNPAAIGHVLLLPKEHYAIMPQIPDSELSYLFTLAKHISQSMLRALKVEGTNLFVANGLAAGQKAQHFMIHIIPRKEGDEVLKLPEHLVPLEKREKAGELVGNRMNELMGIKKEKVLVQKKLSDVEEKKEDSDEKPAESEIVEAEFEEEKKLEEELGGEGDSDGKEDDVEEDEKKSGDDVEEVKEDSDEPEDGVGEDEKDVEENSDEKEEESEEEKEEEAEESETEEDKKEDAGNSDLDDIANLFK